MAQGSKPRTFWLHFNRINVQRGNPDVWTVHLSDQCIQAKSVRVYVPLQTVYKGATARQPRAYMKGKGIIRVHKDYVSIVRENGYRVGHQ